MPTINVTDELELFLKSLKEQTYKDFELIAVDQNNDDRAYKILEKYEDDFEIKYMKSDRKGLSLNRNRGLLVMDGEITGFPDDDCEYQPDTLEKVVKFFKENEDKRIYSCRTLERGKDYGTGIMSEQNLKLTKGNIEKTVKSITFFCKLCI